MHDNIPGILRNNILLGDIYERYLPYEKKLCRLGESIIEREFSVRLGKTKEERAGRCKRRRSSLT